MPQKTKFIYFDIGGVLMDYSKAMQQIATEYGITVAALDHLYEKHGHKAERGDITLQGLWEIYEKELDIKGRVDFDFLDYWIENSHPIEENHATLTELAQSHPVGILSNMYPGAFPKLLATGRIPDVDYSRIIESSEIKFIKPQEEIYTIAQSISGYSPSDIIYIDDRKDFVEYAKTLGWNGIWYKKGNGIDLKSSLSQLLNS
jgi:HAD superfamily hydrolase (TIGR01509 family)